MKKHKKTINIDNKIYICTLFLMCLFFVLVWNFFNGKPKLFIKTEQTVASVKENHRYLKNNNPIDVEQILNENLNSDIQKEIYTEDVDMEYQTLYVQSDEISEGVIQILQEGRVGKKTINAIRNYENGELISKEQISEKIIKAPVERIVQVGTGKGKVYKINEGDTVYVTAQSVAVRLQPDEKSEKICTLNKNEFAQVLKIEGEWLFISNVELKGYVPSNCMTSKNPNEIEDKNYANEYSKRELLSNLRFDMDLRQPSKLTLEQFKKVLSNDANDKRNVFENNAEYFYYIEQQYKINGIFVAAVGIHESAWGTSTISVNKKNLFGYGAVDSNPYGGAFEFSSYSECIDLIARVFVKYYLNSPGTVIYDGSKTDGKFYSGSTLSDVNKKYASDKNWANAVYKWMEYLYKKI